MIGFRSSLVLSRANAISPRALSQPYVEVGFSAVGMFVFVSTGNAPSLREAVHHPRNSQKSPNIDPQQLINSIKRLN